MRCLVDLGDPSDPASIAYRVSRTIIDDEVYSAVRVHLTKTGVDLDGPPGYLTWLDRNRQRFMARCADINAEPRGPADKQPRNYLIFATITDSSGAPMRARGDLFFHDADPQINTP